MLTDRRFSFFGLNIVIISAEDWGENFVSKHHIALTLAKWNNTVWFICPTIGNAKPEVKEIMPNIMVIKHKALRGVNVLPEKLARILAQFEVKTLLKMVKRNIDVVWSFDPYHLQFLKLFHSNLTIYHAVDNHYTPLEARIVKEADVVLSNASATLSRIRHGNKHKVGHGVASYFFDTTIPVRLPGKHKLKVGYVGNLNNKYFDFNLLLQLAKDHSEVGFYLIGPRGDSNLSRGHLPVYDWNQVDRFSNVFWLGQLPSEQVPSYLKEMDILLKLYKPDESGFTVNAHKTLEYLSSGKLIIAPAHGEDEPISHLMLQSNSISDLPATFAQAVTNPEKYLLPGKCAERISYAFAMNYENRLKHIEKICADTAAAHD